MSIRREDAGEALDFSELFTKANLVSRRPATNVSIEDRYPKNAEYFRTSAELTLISALVKVDRVRYVIQGGVIDLLPDDHFPAELTLAANRDGELFLWPAPFPTEDDRDSDWLRTWLEALALSRTQWVRVPRRGRQLGNVKIATGDYGEPAWPEKSMAEIVNEAFGDRVLRGADHPIVAMLAGV